MVYCSVHGRGAAHAQEPSGRDARARRHPQRRARRRPALPAHAPRDTREHAQHVRRPRVTARVHPRGRGLLPRRQAQAAHRWCAARERECGVRSPAQRPRGRRGLGLALSEQGTRCAGGLDPRRLGGVHPPSQAPAQVARRRDAPGGSHRGRGTVRAGAPVRAPRRGPRECQGSRAGTGAFVRW